MLTTKVLSTCKTTFPVASLPVIIHTASGLIILNGPPRACFTENLTVMLPNCTSQLGYECLNGGKWHPECLGCICPPGFGGYNCGRCSISGRSFPGSYTRTLSKDQSPTALANSACKSMGFDSVYRIYRFRQLYSTRQCTASPSI